MINLETFTPSPHLWPVVERYMLIEAISPPGAITNFTMIPAVMEVMCFNLNGYPQVCLLKDIEINLLDCMLIGQHSNPFEIRVSGHMRMFGVHINTPGLYKLLNMPVHHLTNGLISLEALIGSEAHSLCQQLQEVKTIQDVIYHIEQFLTHLLLHSKVTVHGTLLQSLSLIKTSRGKVTVKEIAAHTRMSERTLQKIFLNQSGASPKEYSKIYRFNEAVRIIMNSSSFSWQNIVTDLGYYDQSHFIHDFKSIAGQNPSEYFRGFPNLHKFFNDY